MANAPLNERRLHDSELTVTATLPNAANTVNSNGIDLGATTPYPTTEGIVVRIDLFGTATGANNKNINIRLQESIDDVSSNYANVAIIANPVLRSVDANAAGHSNSNVRISLPPGTKRWIRAVALGEANGGDSSDGTFGIKLEF
jgi:hypothetical protein